MSLSLRWVNAVNWNIRVGQRLLSTSSKPPIKLVAELRKLTNVSLSKAREALLATNNDVHAATAWLENDLASSGAKKLQKLEGRSANEGVIAISVLSPGLGQSVGGYTRAAMVELNCETDFVSRNELFRKLASNIAHSAAFHAELSPREQPFQSYQVSDLGDAPLLFIDQPELNKSVESVNDHIRHAVAKLGEKISLRRSIALTREVAEVNTGFRVASYIHGALPDDPKVGRIGTLVDICLTSATLASVIRNPDFNPRLLTLERALARQIVGLNASHIRPPTTTKDDFAGYDNDEVLYNQQFMMHPTLSGETVQSALSTWAKQEGLDDIHVSGFIRWKVGEEDGYHSQ